MEIEFVLRAVASLVFVCLLAVVILGVIVPRLYSGKLLGPRGMCLLKADKDNCEMQVNFFAMKLIGRLVLSREHQLVTVQVSPQKTLLLALSPNGVTKLEEIDNLQGCAPQVVESKNL